MVVNRWELERHKGRWMIARRTLLPVDGSAEQQELLRRGLNGVYRRSLGSEENEDPIDG